MKNTWRGVGWASKRNLLEVVMRAQGNTDRLHTDGEPEDPKTRRRRLYKMVSEERPTFPVQQRNFHTMVMENKEVAKVLSMLSSCTQELRQVQSLRFCPNSGEKGFLRIATEFARKNGSNTTLLFTSLILK